MLIISNVDMKRKGTLSAGDVDLGTLNSNNRALPNRLGKALLYYIPI